MFPNYLQTTIGIMCLALSACQYPFVNTGSSTLSSSHPEAGTIILSTETEKPDAPPNPATHAIFQPILTDLQQKTQLPIRLPTYVPETDESIPVYARLETVTPSRYQIMLAFTEDCTGGTACRLGAISGEIISPQHTPLTGEKVAVAEGLIGYLTPSICRANCSDAILTWEQEGVRYTVALKAGKIEQLTRMANSAFLAVPINSSESQRKTQETANIPAKFTISSQGIGDAKIGMIYGQLKAKLGKAAQFQVKAPFIVDLDAIAVSQSGEIQYYIIYPTATTLDDSDKIELLLTTNPKYLTAEGVGVGMSLQEAENIYGEATLSYNTQNESREMVRFANYNSPNIIFTPTVPSQSFAGIYPSSSGEYHKTTEFNDSATIKSIFVGF